MCVYKDPYDCQPVYMHSNMQLYIVRFGMYINPSWLIFLFAESESVSGDAKKIEEQQPSAPVLRKSVRLRQRHTTADHEAQESSNKTTGAAKIKQEPAAKEEPQVKMEAGKSPKVDDRVAVKKEVKEEEKKEGEGPDLVKEEERRYVKSEESESGGEEDSDGSSEEEESDEDPDRLWCICRQPHDDRWGILLYLHMYILFLVKNYAKSY